MVIILCIYLIFLVTNVLLFQQADLEERLFHCTLWSHCSVGELNHIACALSVDIRFLTLHWLGS